MYIITFFVCRFLENLLVLVVCLLNILTNFSYINKSALLPTQLNKFHSMFKSISLNVYRFPPKSVQEMIEKTLFSGCYDKSCRDVGYDIYVACIFGSVG